MERSAAEVKQWLKALLGDLLGVSADKIDVHAPFDRYGLDSSTAISVTVELEEFLGCDLEPTLLYKYPTIAELAQHLGRAE
jgi:acyl carrier protein